MATKFALAASGISVVNQLVSLANSSSKSKP
jgi:hypothetical protein